MNSMTDEVMSDYIVVIGLETHVQVNSKSKLFCGCKNMFGIPPNTAVCPICLGMPGILPTINYEVVRKAIKAAILFNCTINKLSFFDRKNYFYPDIPKSYQITQYHRPIAENGYIELSDGMKVRIRRLHIEEDVGKLLHPEAGKSPEEVEGLGIIRADYSFVDMNRSGIPLFEIVTEPDIHNPQQAYEYLLNLKRKLQFEGISNCDMEKGQLRCDVNISVRDKNSSITSDRVEIKNLNSFRFVRDAINFEINRQVRFLQRGERVQRETRLWDPYKKETYPLRSKETVEDYRYFFEPDLPPLILQENEISKIKEQIAESPLDILNKYVQQGALTLKDKESLLSDEEMCLFYLEVARRTKNPKASFNWVANELKGLANEVKVSVWELGISIYDMANFIEKVVGGKIDKAVAKNALRRTVEEKADLNRLLEEVENVSKSTVNLEEVVDQILKENKNLVEEYLRGKENVKNVFIGKILSLVKNQFSALQVRQILESKLKKKI